MNRKRFKAIFIGFLIIIAACCIYWLISHFKKEKGGEKPLEISNPVISELKIDPENPQSIDFIRVEPVFKDRWVTKEVKFNYFWFVNGNEIPGNDSPLLEKKFYKKGDSAYCRVVVIKGAYISDPVKSKEVKVRNSAPIINYSAVPPFQVPGEFNYRVVAEDPDGDPVIYRLLSPLNAGIVLNSKTGAVKWHITGGQPSSYIVIVFEAIDSEGASTRGSIELNLSNGREITQ